LIPRDEQVFDAPRFPPPWNSMTSAALEALLAGIANPGHAIRAIKGLHTWRSSLLLTLTSLPITTAALRSGRRRFFLTNRWREVVLSRLSVADGLRFESLSYCQVRRRLPDCLKDWAYQHYR
jgi:hypothetical protein